MMHPFMGPMPYPGMMPIVPPSMHHPAVHGFMSHYHPHESKGMKGKKITPPVHMAPEPQHDFVPEAVVSHHHHNQHQHKAQKKQSTKKEGISKRKLSDSSEVSLKLTKQKKETADKAIKDFEEGIKKPIPRSPKETSSVVEHEGEDKEHFKSFRQMLKPKAEEHKFDLKEVERPRKSSYGEKKPEVYQKTHSLKREMPEEPRGYMRPMKADRHAHEGYERHSHQKADGYMPQHHMHEEPEEVEDHEYEFIPRPHRGPRMHRGEHRGHDYYEEEPEAYEPHHEEEDHGNEGYGDSSMFSPFNFLNFMSQKEEPKEGEEKEEEHEGGIAGLQLPEWANGLRKYGREELGGQIKNEITRATSEQQGHEPSNLKRVPRPDRYRKEPEYDSHHAPKEVQRPRPYRKEAEQDHYMEAPKQVPRPDRYREVPKHNSHHEAPKYVPRPDRYREELVHVPRPDVHSEGPEHDRYTWKGPSEEETKAWDAVPRPEKFVYLKRDYDEKPRIAPVYLDLHSQGMDAGRRQRMVYEAA